MGTSKQTGILSLTAKVRRVSEENQRVRLKQITENFIISETVTFKLSLKDKRKQTRDIEDRGRKFLGQANTMCTGLGVARRRARSGN